MFLINTLNFQGFFSMLLLPNSDYNRIKSNKTPLISSVTVKLYLLSVKHSEQPLVCSINIDVIIIIIIITVEDTIVPINIVQRTTSLTLAHGRSTS